MKNIQAVTAIAKVSLVTLFVGSAIANAGTIPDFPETLKAPATQVLSL